MLQCFCQALPLTCYNVSVRHYCSHATMFLSGITAHMLLSCVNMWSSVPQPRAVLQQLLSGITAHMLLFLCEHVELCATA